MCKHGITAQFCAYCCGRERFIASGVELPTWRPTTQSHGNNHQWSEAELTDVQNLNLLRGQEHAARVKEIAERACVSVLAVYAQKDALKNNRGNYYGGV